MYSKQVWHDLPAYDTPITAARLNYIEDGIEAASAALDDVYTKPVGGIPKTDLATGVQASLNLADSALQFNAVETVSGRTGDVLLYKYDVGLGNVDNTADATKAVATAAALLTPRKINGVDFDGSANITIVDATKEPAITAGTGAQYWRGDKTWHTLNTAAVAGAEDISHKNQPNGYCGLDENGMVAWEQMGMIGGPVDCDANQTLTNKRIVPRVLVINDSPSNATIDVDRWDAVRIVNQVTTLNMSGGMTGTPTDFQTLTMHIVEPGLAGINWGDKFVAPTAGSALLELPYGGLRPLVTLRDNVIQSGGESFSQIDNLVPVSGWGSTGLPSYSDRNWWANLHGTLAGVSGYLWGDGQAYRTGIYFHRDSPGPQVSVSPGTPFIASSSGTNRVVMLQFRYDATFAKFILVDIRYYGY